MPEWTYFSNWVLRCIPLFVLFFISQFSFPAFLWVIWTFFLELNFDLSIVFLSVSLCTLCFCFFLVVVILDITWYINITVYWYWHFTSSNDIQKPYLLLLPFILPHLHFNSLKIFPLHISQTTSNSITSSASIIESHLWNLVSAGRCVVLTHIFTLSIVLALLLMF